MAGQTKTGDNSQFLVTADAAGKAVTPSPDVDAGRGRPPLGDGDGRVAVRLADGAGWLDGGFSARNQGFAPSALVDTATIQVVPLQLAHVFGHKSMAGTHYVQFYDQAGGAPVGTPAVVLPLVGAPNQAFSFDVPWRFFVGCVIAISSDRFTFVSPGPILYFDAVWLS
jgi:hypothetical protein